MTESAEACEFVDPTHEVHHLASLIGVLGLRWYVIRQSLPADSALALEANAMDDSLADLRGTISRLSTMMKPLLHAAGQERSAHTDDEGARAHE